MMPLALAVIFACAVWCAIGLWIGVRWCAHKHHCIRQQRIDVKRWTKEITGEITQEMQSRLAMREAARKALRDTGENPAIVDKLIAAEVERSRAHTVNIRPPRPKKDPQ